MNHFFNYTTLDVELKKDTRSLIIGLKGQKERFIGLEMLFELESVLNWCANKVEIHSILIRSQSGMLGEGIDRRALAEFDENHLTKILSKLQKINHSFYHLPQTVIIDLGDGTKNLTSELTIGADIRIASTNVNIEFNHTALGLIPCSGGMGMLTTVVGHAWARKWLMLSESISRDDLIQSGYVSRIYDSTNRVEVTDRLLKQIHAQAPVQRIQLKLGLYESIKENIEQSLVFEKQIAKAALINQDWKEMNKEFMPAKHLAHAVKLTLVKNHKEDTELMN